MTVIEYAPYAPLIPVALLAPVLLWQTFCGIRWTVRYGWPSIEIPYWPSRRLILHRNDTTQQHVQASMRRAVTIKRGWRRTARLLDLAVEDKTARWSDHVGELFADQSRNNVATQLRKNNQANVSKVVTPKLKTIADEFSVNIDTKALGPINVNRWNDKAEDLAHAWRVHRVKVTAPEPGLVRARAFLREPLWADIPNPLVRHDSGLWLPAAGPGMLAPDTPILLQVDEDGNPILINMATGSHILIAGITRSGKSVTANGLLVALNLMHSVRLYIIDANLGTVAPWWRTAYRVCDDIHPDGPTAILQEIREEMEQRKPLFFQQRTDKLIHFRPDFPLIVLLIDELANYTRHPDKKAREKFLAELQAVVSQCHKFGIRIVLLTQKPEADVIPTGIRTNLSGRICHQVDTVEDFLHAFPMGRDLPFTAADRAMLPGISITQVAGMKQPARARSVNTPAAACWTTGDAICAHGGLLRPLPGDTKLIEAEGDLEHAAYMSSVFN